MLINTTYLSYFKILIIFSFFLPKFVYSSCDPDNALADYEHPGSSWCYEQSTTQMFYNFQEAFITKDNTKIDLESGDVIAAFKNVDPDGTPENGDEYEICLGWSNVIVMNDGATSFQVFMNGSDGFVEGLNEGENPTNYRIWNNDENLAYDAIIDNKEPFEDVNGDGCYDAADGDTFTDTNGNGSWDPSTIPGFNANSQHFLQKIKGFDIDVDCNGDAIVDDCDDNPNQAGCAFEDDCRICIGGQTCIDESYASFYNEVDGFITENDFGGGYDCNMSCPDDDNYGYFIGNCGDCLSAELDPDFWKDCNDDCHPTETPYGCSGDQDCGLKEFDSLYMEYSDTSLGCCNPDNMTTWYADYDLDLLGDPNNQYSICLPELFDSIVTNNYDLHPDCNSNSVDDCGVCDGFNLDKDCNDECFGDATEDLCGECDNNLENDNSSCTGCTDPDAVNHNPDALFYDGSCYFEVWPGDTDTDGIVGVDDIIPIGIFWGQQGTPRTITSGNDFTWQLQYGYDNWTNKMAIFADANGDGIVNIFDILVVFINWGNINETAYLNSSTNFYYDEINLELYRENFEEIYNNIPYGYGNNTVKLFLENTFGFEPIVDLPQEYKLHQNRPNPFNPTTNILYEIPNKSHIQIIVTNVIGEVVSEYERFIESPGIYNYNFDASQLPSGIYIYHLRTSSGLQLTDKMMLIK